MPDQAPPAPDGCVYGPWWDDSLQWLAIADDRHGRWLAIYDHEGWGLYDVDFYEPSAYFVPQLLRLAKENAELKAKIGEMRQSIRESIGRAATRAYSPTRQSLVAENYEETKE